MKTRIYAFLLIALLVPVPALLVSQAMSAGAAAQPALHILDRWKLSEGGSWGHLNIDAAANLLYIPRQGHIAVVDLSTGKLVGKVPGFTDARVVALDGKGKYGYATDMQLGSVGYVRVFDRSTFNPVAAIAVGRIPSAIIFDPVTKNVFTFSTSDKNMAVIDPASNTVSATVPLPGKPHLAVTDGKGAIFVSFRGIGKLLRIDTASHAVTADWSIQPCAEFHGLTWDEANHQIIGSCFGQHMIAIAAATGQVTPAGDCTVDATDLALDPARHLLFSGSTSGVLSVYRQESPSKFTLETQLQTDRRAGTITVDSRTGRVYLVTSDFGPAKVNGPGMEESEAHLVPVEGTFRVIVAGR